MSRPHQNPEPLNISPLLLPEYVLGDGTGYPRTPAIIDASTGRRLEFEELYDSVWRAASSLADLGLKPGDVAAIYSRNCVDYPVVFHAVVAAGGAVTTINPMYTHAEVVHQLRDSGTSLLFTSRELYDAAKHASARSGIKRIIVIDAQGSRGRLLSLEALVKSGSRRQGFARGSQSDLIAMPYSSGTSGFPKGVMLTHRNIVANLQQYQAAEQFQRGEVIVAPLPMHHIYGLNNAMNSALTRRATLIILPRVDIESFFKAIETYRVATALLVPPLVEAMASHPSSQKYDLSSLRELFCGAAPLAESAARACAARTGCQVRQGYGMTESSSTMFSTPRGRQKINSAGFPLPGTEFRIVEVATGHDVAFGELGEVWARGPQVMKGYLNCPEASRAMVDDEGWLHTGDVGVTDEEGYLYLAERPKDLVKFRSLHYSDRELRAAMVEDAAMRRKTAQRLAFQSRLLDSVRESVVATDVNGWITHWNKGAEALFGYSNQEAMGAHFGALVNPPEPADGAFDARRDVRSEEGWHGQLLRRRRDGTTIWTDVFVSVIADADGNPSGYVAIHRDITDLKRNAAQLKELASRLMDVREQERGALARELHDHLGALLTRLKVEVCSIGEQLPARLRGTPIKTMTDRIDQMVDIVRHIAFELRPLMLDDLGLEAAIEWQTKEFAKWSGCRASLKLELHSLSRDRERDTAMFRVLQESLTNVARHAHATSVCVSATMSRGLLNLRVEDDGIGIPDCGVQASLGIVGMRERIEGVGGQFEVRRGRRRGTIVSVAVPIGVRGSRSAREAGGHDSTDHR
jgi:PAS domain S-box-containing protein